MSYFLRKFEIESFIQLNFYIFNDKYELIEFLNIEKFPILTWQQHHRKSPIFIYKNKELLKNSKFLNHFNY